MSPLYQALCDLSKARDERNAAARLVKVCPMNSTPCADSSEESRCGGCASVYLFREPRGVPVMREALERIAGFTLSQFMGPNDMALECVNVAQAALAAGVPKGL